jgi:ribosome-associated protein
MEQWRDRLISDDKEALTEFINAHPQVDVQTLRQLIKKAIIEKNNEKSMGGSKALFRFLRSNLS